MSITSMAVCNMRRFQRISLSFLKSGKYFSNTCNANVGNDNLTKVQPNVSKSLNKLQNGPGLKDFLIVGKNFPAPKNSVISNADIPYLQKTDYTGNNRKVFFEVYGCQMNVNDTEVIWAILKDVGYVQVDDIKESDVVLVITCAVREGAEAKIWKRLKHISAMKRNRSVKKGPFQIGILGCMAERLKVQLLEKEKWVDVVAGPDSYRDLPRLLAVTQSGQSAVNVLLSLDETYADVMPVRLNAGSVTAFVSIMRGCDNMCTYCIVPFTRGRERSRAMESVENEVKILAEQGIKEITLLGQNVNSYRDLTSDPERTKESSIVSGFKTVYKQKIGGARFAELLECVAQIAPKTRIRFTSPHPKDFPDEVLNVIKAYPNICKNMHLPAQSGNSDVLDRMRRGYTREAYLELVSNIRSIIPDISISSDFICGFCGETDDEFADTISLIKDVGYNVAYLFAYSMREKTTAHRRFKDDVSEEIKSIRLTEMIDVFRNGATELNRKFVGQEQTILIEGTSKRSQSEVFGRNDANIKVIVPIEDIPIENEQSDIKRLIQPGDFLRVKIIDANSQVLKGKNLYHTELNVGH